MPHSLCSPTCLVSTLIRKAPPTTDTSLLARRQAIRAYTLAKLDRRQEANEDCNKMKNMKPQTEEALRWARNALTELGRGTRRPLTSLPVS